MTVKSFEELEVWQLSKKLSVLIYTITESEKLRKDYGFKEQLRRAAISIVSNIAEGFERNGYKEFAYFLNIAKGSAGEIRAQLHVAKELGYISDNEFLELHEKVTQISRMIFKLIKYLRTRSTNRPGGVSEDEGLYTMQNLEPSTFNLQPED